MQTLESLRRERTDEEELRALLSVLAELEFPVSEWPEGGAALTMARAIATGLAGKAKLIKPVTEGGSVGLAKGGWLDLLGEQFYVLQRAPATRTRQVCSVSCSAGTGPQVVNPGFIARSPSTGNRYVLEGEPVKVEDGKSADVELVADAPGSSFADGPDTITEIVTPLPGLEITNPLRAFDFVPARRRGTGLGVITPVQAAVGVLPTPARIFTITVVTSGNVGTGGALRVETLEVESGIATRNTYTPIPPTIDLGGGVLIKLSDGLGLPSFVAGDVYTFAARVPPVVQQGADAETDAELAERCRGRWPSLGRNFTEGAYLSMIRQASIEGGLGISRFRVRPSADVPGQVEVIVASVSGSPGPAVVLSLQEYLDARTGQNERANVRAARGKSVIAGGSVVVRAAALAATQRAAAAAWSRHLGRAPIGGDLSTGFPGVVRLNELVQALMDAGAIDVSDLTLNGAPANLALAFDEAPVVGQPLATSLTWHSL